MITCTAATNSAPSSRYSTASEPITTISDSALLIGCRCTSRFTAPATQITPKIRNIIRCMCSVLGSQSAVPSFSLSENWRLETALLRLQRHNQGRNYQVRDGQRQQELPSESHELVITKARQRSTNPDINKQKAKHPQQEPEHR